MIRDFLELVERGHDGPRVKKDDWDLDYVAMPIAELVEKYELSRAKDDILITDEEEIKKYYAAARELIISCGVYNQSTERVIRLSADEIDEAARTQKRELTVGEGNDAFTFYARKAEDKRRPGVVAGNPGCPMTEAEFQATVRSWACEPSVDMVTCGSIVEVDGKPVRSAEASELIAVRRELRYLNGICADLGRPGIGRLAAESAVSEIGDLAAFAPGLIRKSDAHLVALNNELIINNDNLLRAASSIYHPTLNASLACVMLGGMAGGAPGAAVGMIASMLAANLVCRADYHLCHPIHIRHIATSTRECMWIQSVACQAFALCAPCVVVGDIYPKSGAGTKELLYETAANAIAITVSGGHLEGVGSCDGVKPNCSGLEARLMGEVGRAVAEQGLTREKANGILLSLLEKYERIFETGNEGKHIFEVYDVKTNRPADAWLKMYDEVKSDLAALGVTL